MNGWIIRHNNVGCGHFMAMDPTVFTEELIERSIKEV